MIKFISILAMPFLALTTDPAPITGWASYYEQDPTDATIEARLEMEHITHADLLWAETLIAVSDCSQIGDRMTVQVGDDTPLRAVVFDCAGNDGTAGWMKDGNILFEFDYYTATYYNMQEVGAVRVRMWE